MAGNYSIGNSASGEAIQINGDIQGSINLAAKPDIGFFYTSNYESYKDLNPERVPQTCRWFLEHSTFQRWRDSTHDNLLWLSADPGCGKSVLSRALIDENLVGKGSANVCYFFFKDNEEQNNTPIALCALLHQLFRKNRQLFQEHVALAVKDFKEGLKGNFEQLWRTFVSAATDPSAGNVVCILDALDECQEADRKKLINHLQSFYNNFVKNPIRESSLKFLVTSRPYADIDYDFSELTENVPTIRLAGEDESERISQEIGIVIDAKVKEIAGRCKLNDRLRSALHTRLCEIPNRTYLWLHLTLDEVRSKISKGKTEKKLLTIINTLSSSVEEAYEKILTNCDQEDARRILQIIIASRRPLTVSEIDIALELEPFSSCYGDLDLEHDGRKESIRKNCGLFVSIIGSHVYLIHQTAREFLIRENIDSSRSQTWKHSINLLEANRVLAEKCVTYLLFKEFQNISASTLASVLVQSRMSTEKSTSGESDRKYHAFLGYSATHWISHVQEARIKDREWILRTEKLCEIEDELSCTWFSIYSKSAYLLLLYSSSSTTPTAPHWAVFLGLVNEKEYLLSNSENSVQEILLQDILLDATKNDAHGRQLVEVILGQRADDIRITEMIIKAAARNKSSGKEIMMLLLKWRADSFNMSMSNVAAFAENFNQTAMKLLLDRRADDIKITEEVVKAAARNESSGKEIMTLLLDRRADSFNMSISNVAALAENFNQTAIKLLLDRRADDIKITEEVVKAAARNESSGKEIMTLFLDRRADSVKITDEVVKAAAENGGSGKEIITLLLDRRGNDVKITEEVIKAAAENGGSGKEIIRLLLDRRGNDVKITEEVIKAAAENGVSGKEIMTLFFDWPVTREQLRHASFDIPDTFEKLTPTLLRVKVYGSWMYSGSSQT